MRAASVAALAAACFGAMAAVLTYSFGCFGEIGGSTMCPDGHATTTMSAQLAVGIVGLVPACATLFFAFRGARRGFVVALVLGLVVWAGWLVLNDAAVHEWGSDMRLVP